MIVPTGPDVAVGVGGTPVKALGGTSTEVGSRVTPNLSKTPTEHISEFLVDPPGQGAKTATDIYRGTTTESAKSSVTEAHPTLNGIPILLENSNASKRVLGFALISGTQATDGTLAVRDGAVMCKIKMNRR